jgi:hypothetical protein
MNKNSTLQSLFNQQSSNNSLIEQRIKCAFHQDYNNMKPSKRSMQFLLDFAASLDCFNTKSLGTIEKLMN